MPAVIGAGAMGTALAVQLRRAGQPVALLATRFDDAFVAAHREGSDHPALRAPFPDAPLFTHDEWEDGLADHDTVVLAVATPGLIPTLETARPFARDDALWVVATKGWDPETLRSTSDVVADAVGEKRVVALVGPSIASEIAAGVPTAVVCASADAGAAHRVAEAFSSDSFRTYTSDDVAGVEVGAALKNVIAIGIGLCEGLAETEGRAMTNAKAFVFTRGLVEMAQLARTLGGRAETVLGLAGAGDLFVTALAGRNGRFGALVGKGVAPQDALAEIGSTVEGFVNGRAAVALGDRHGLAMPVVRAVASVLYGGANPAEAIASLFAGGAEAEFA